MTSNRHKWQPGETGNRKGRPPKGRALAELLKLKGEGAIRIGGEEKSAHEALAEAVWQFVVTGRVWLSGKEIVAESVSDWANVVKWLYSYLEPPTRVEPEPEEMVVRVIRVAQPYADALPDGEETDLYED